LQSACLFLYICLKALNHFDKCKQPTRIHAIDRVGICVEVLVEGDRVEGSAWVGVLRVEAAEGRVVVAGSEVEEAEVRVVLLAGVAVVVSRGAGEFEGLAKSVVDLGGVLSVEIGVGDEVACLCPKLQQD